MPAESLGRLFVAEPRGHYLLRPPLVIDCSALAAVLFNEPDRDVALQAMTGRHLFAPDLLDHEFISVAIRKSVHLPADFIERALDDFLVLRITRCTPDVRAQWQLARNHQLTAYDAAYLQVAIELKAPLATLDRRLGGVASQVLPTL